MTLPARVVLHVGMAKTGSTAVQNVMAANREALLAQGVLFPQSVLRRSIPDDPARTPGHLDLVRQLVAGEETPLIAECAAAGPGLHTLFLSIENLFNIEADAGVEALAAFLAGREIRLVAVLRDPQDWIASRYYEVVTTGFVNEARPIDAYVEEALSSGALDYPARLDRLAAAFRPAATSVHDHREIDAAGSAVAVFLAELGVALDAPEAARAPRVNVSLAFPESIEAHRRLNGFVRRLPQPQRFAFARSMKRHYAELAAGGALRPGGAAISPPLRRALRAALEPGCRALSARWFAGRPFGPDRAWVEQAPPPPDETLVAAIQDFGFEALLAQRAAAESGPAAEADEARAGARFGFGIAETRRLRAACAGARVILEYGAGDATPMAAAMAGKFVMAVESSWSLTLRSQIALGAAALPSPAVIHHVDPEGEAPHRRYAEAIWDEAFFRHPDVILIAGRHRAACLAAAQARIARPVTVFFDDWLAQPVQPAADPPVRPARILGRMAEFHLVPRPAAPAGRRAGSGCARPPGAATAAEAPGAAGGAKPLA